jgi:hypothetical protein
MAWVGNPYIKAIMIGVFWDVVPFGVPEMEMSA